MPSPFPGMDPYLEDPAIWSGFHHAFLSALQERLGPAVRPKYFVRVDERVYVAHKEDPAYRFIVPDVRVIEAARKRPPATSGGAAGGLVIAPPLPVVEMIDPEIHEHRLEILDRVDRSVVTVIEMRSPTNKMPRSVGRDSFLQKRNEVYGTDAHWMEIDLLRDGARTANVAASGEAEYQIYLSRAGKPRRGFVWPVPVRERLPVIGVPLRNGDADVPLDLQAAFDQVYDVGGYDLDLDYRRAPSCPLNPLQAEWAQTILGDRSQP